MTTATAPAARTTPRFVLDSYGNPAVVTGFDAHVVRFVQLAGSDFGRHGSTPRSKAVEVAATDWSLARAADAMAPRRAGRR
jgi:hypothetical protein